MPIYEFYCEACHTVYSFLSQRVDSEVVPACPTEEDHQLQRKPSQFATISSSDQKLGDDEMIPGVDEDRLERAVDQLAGEFEHGNVDADDPKVMAQMFRRFGEAGGLKPGPMMEEMLAKLESADDIEQVEAEFQGLDDSEADVEQFFQVRKALRDRCQRQPQVDETLYFL